MSLLNVAFAFLSHYHMSKCSFRLKLLPLLSSIRCFNVLLDLSIEGILPEGSVHCHFDDAT